MNGKKHLDIIVPAYNEDQCIELFYEEIKKVLEFIDITYSVIFIDDGSKDKTLEAIKKIADNNEKGKIKFISFSRNFGKEAAIYAGLKSSIGDYTVLMDCDLQHPPKVLPQMLEALECGYDCCAAKRVNRDGEPFIRSMFARVFYKLINKVGTVKMEQGSTDFRMMNRKMLDAVLLLNERERFSKGLLSWVGFNVKWIEFENVKRIAGNTTWSFISLMKYAVSGIVAFTTAPLRISAFMGIFVVLTAALYSIFVFFRTLIFGAKSSGFATLAIIIMFLGGVTISLLGIIGEYLARLYSEIKKRPIYISKESNIGKCEVNNNESKKSEE